MANNRSINIYSLMRRIVQEELAKAFGLDQEYTSQVRAADLSSEGTGDTSPKRRKRRTRRSLAGIKGKVTKPTDKRLKANREL